QNADHSDCPGDLFDWHRFARSIYDWWWAPFDFDDAHTTTAVAVRAYRAAIEATPLVEYWYHYDPALFTNRTTVGIGGAGSSPNPFRLDEGSAVYAVANGELVAARVLQAGPGVSMSFALVRHAIYHRASPLIGMETALNQLMGVDIPPVDQGR